MSLENLKEYARRCATDPELLAAARTIGMTDIEEHMRHAGSLGLDWTRNDLAAFRKEVTDDDDDTDDLVDLTEEELERVAGGALAATLVAAIAVGAGVGVAVAGAATAGAVGGVAASGRGGW